MHPDFITNEGEWVHTVQYESTTEALIAEPVATIACMPIPLIYGHVCEWKPQCKQAIFQLPC